MSEFELIREIAQRVKPRADVLLGIGDDCAILAPPKGKRLALSTDTLVSDVHFFADDPAQLNRGRQVAGENNQVQLLTPCVFK